MKSYDIIAIGSGFATSFLLSSFLEKAKPSAKVLVLERGRWDTHDWQVENEKESSMLAEETFVNKHPDKKWVYIQGFGGGSRAWTGNTPRMLPSDFKINTLYGVGKDWPVSYEELEEFYCDAEEIMAISGPGDKSICPRSRPYPQQPHNFNDPDRTLKEAYPDQYFHVPTARARSGTKNRPGCCGSTFCRICPADAKFTVLNEMAHLYGDPRVDLMLESTALNIETAGSAATGVNYLKDGIVSSAKADLIVLGANAIFNPFILMKSGLDHELLGKNLGEQVSVTANAELDGMESFQGSTSITGHGYMLYDGSHRSEHAACLIESINITEAGRLRPARGKWTHRAQFVFIFENLPSEDNKVIICDDNQDIPETIYHGHSDYTQKAIDRLNDVLPNLLKKLPVEKIEIAPKTQATESHIMGTTVMGNDPEKSIVDRHLIHHQVRNIVVLGSGVFPTCPPANPTLTLSALSLWTAKNLFS